jgi:hypothetical protein
MKKGDTMRIIPFIKVLLAVVVYPLTVLSQGLYWEQTVTMPAVVKGEELRTKGYVVPMKLKSTDDDGNGIIIRGDKEIMYTVNEKENTYSEMTFKEFEAQMTQMNEQMKKMKEQMKDMPAEQRKMLEGMMSGMMNEKEYAIKKTSEKKKVIGYNCEKILVYEDNKPVGEFWITKDIGSMKEYAKNWVNLMDKMVQAPMAKMYRKIAELDGFAMESKFGDMRTTTTKLEKRSISASEFEVPAGYKKVEMEKMNMMEEEN